jgi:hypothetical protein
LFVLFLAVDVRRKKGRMQFQNYLQPWQTVRRGGCIFSIILYTDRLTEERVRKKGAVLIKMHQREEFTPTVIVNNDNLP